MLQRHVNLKRRQWPDERTLSGMALREGEVEMRQSTRPAGDAQQTNADNNRIKSL